MPTLVALLIAAAIVVGAWLVMTGAVLILDGGLACLEGTPPALSIRQGIATCWVGLMIFVAGVCACARVLL